MRDRINANELTALIGECLRETDDHEFFLKLESVLRQQQAEIEALKAKLKQYHLKEDLDRNINLIYGKEFIK